MKAFLMNNNRQLQIDEVENPIAKEDNIIARVRSASICGTDIRTFLKGSDKIDTPRIIGHEFAGDIVHAGKLANEYGFFKNDRITIAPAIGCGECWPCKTGHTNMCDHLKTIGYQFEGVFAEYLLIPSQAIKMNNVIKLPDGIDYDDATLVEPAACALNGQRYMKVTKGDYVVIYGSGMIGCLHAELAFLSGAEKVVIVEPAEKRGKIALEKVPGVIWINPLTQNTIEEVDAITNGRGANVVITSTSVPSVHEEAQIIAAKMGRISLFGGLAGESKGFIDSNLIHYKELQVCGVHATTADCMREIINLMEDKKLDAKKYIEKRIKLEDIEDGFVAIRDKNIMKVVVHP